MNQKQIEAAMRGRNTLRQACRTDLFFLCKVLGYPDVCWRVHGPILDVLQKFPGGEDHQNKKTGLLEYRPYKEIWQLQGRREKLILYPRGHLKTTVVSQAHAIQWIINYPDIRILLSCATGDQVEKVIRAIKGVFQYSDAFRAVFPDFCPPREKASDFGSKDQFIVPARRTPRGEPTMFAVTVGKTIAGYHPDVIFHSDLVDKENVKTPGGIRDVIEHFQYMAPLLERYSARDGYPASRGFTFVEGTPYDFGDLHNMLMKNPDWHPVVKPAANPYPPRTAADILWPERFPAEELERLRREMGDWMFCTPHETPILMADASFKPIGDVAIGDVVLGWDDNESKPRLRKSRVLDKGFIEAADVQEITMASGRKLTATPEHLWLSGWQRRKGHHRRYAQVGGKYRSVNMLSFVDHPGNEEMTADQQKMAHRLSGLFDGEGSLTAKVTLNFTQGNVKNAVVCARIADHLTALGFSYQPFHRKCAKAHWQPTTLFQLHGGYRTVFRFMRMCDPARRQEIVDRLLPHTSRFTQRDKVVSVKPAGKRKVYWLTTETGNYVAWGYASKNSAQYLMKCVAQGDGLCDPKEIKFLSHSIVRELLPRLRLQCIIDLAGMEKTRDGDDTVLTVAGFDRDGRAIVPEIHCGQFAPEEVIGLMFDIKRRYPSLICFKIEKDSHARVLLPFLQREMSKRNIYLSIIEIKRDTHTSKQQRIRGLRPWLKNSLITFSDAIPLTTKQKLLDQVAQFPSQSSGVHDDILDTLADAMQDGEGGVTVDVVADPPDMKFGQFGVQRPPDRFLGFGEAGVSRWLYGEDGKQDVRSMTGLL